MEDGFFKPIDLRQFLKNSPFLHPFKESYTDYLFQILEQSIRYWDEGNNEKALEQIKIFNSNFEEFQFGNLMELAINIENTDPSKAISYLNSVSTESLTSKVLRSWYHFTLAVFHFMNLDIDFAKEECDKAIKYEKKIWLVYYLRGTCLAMRELHYSAIPDFKKALKDGYKRNEILACLAYSYLRTRQYRKSFKVHKKIVDQFPENHKVQYNTGLCYKRYKKYKTAIKYFSKAIELDPSIPGYRLTRGRVLMKLRDYNEAAKDLNLAFESGNQIAGKLLRVNEDVMSKKLTSRQAERMVRKIATGTK